MIDFKRKNPGIGHFWSDEVSWRVSAPKTALFRLVEQRVIMVLLD